MTLWAKTNYFTRLGHLLVLERKAPATVTYNTSTNRKLLVKGRPVFDGQGEIRYIINTVWDLTVITYNREIDLDTARDYFMVHEDIIACSEPMLEVIDYALKVANSDSTVLISGETGVGKSIIATMIHHASPRKNRPILKLNCAAIPESLIESELFGYEAGSFTPPLALGIWVAWQAGLCLRAFEQVARDRHQRARIARRNGRSGSAILDLLDGHAHGRIFFLAQRDLDGVVHGDDLARGHHGGALVRERTQTVWQTDQQQARVRVALEKFPARRKRDGRAVVTAHAVNSQGDHENPLRPAYRPEKERFTKKPALRQ